MTLKLPSAARLALLLSTASLVGCYQPVTEVFDADATRVHIVTVGTSSSFVLQAPTGTVMIDAMTDEDFDALDEGLRALGLAPGDIDTLLITHGHFDHAGSAKKMQQRWGVDVAVHKADVPLLKSGTSGSSRIVAPEGYLIQAISDFTYPPVTPDIVLTGSTDLMTFGVPGRIHQVSGHTPGHQVVTLPTGEAFSGDLFRTNGEQPVTHMFTDDLHGDYAHIRDLIEGGATRFYPAHGSPTDTAAVVAWLDSVGG